MIEGNMRPDVERSLALHREVAERLRRDPRLLEHAKARVQRWFEDGSAHRSWATAWSEVLEGGLDEVVALLIDRGERAHDLRHVSPFAGVLDARTRWAILRRCSSRDFER